MGNEMDQPDAAGASAAERAAALAILLQRQNLLQIQQSLPTLRGRLGTRAYAAWVAAEFPGLPDHPRSRRRSFYGCSAAVRPRWRRY